LDHALIVELLAERSFSLRQFSESLREQIDDWSERSSEKSVLYRKWIRGAKAHSQAAELFGSLSLRAIILRELSKGLALEEISRRWKVESLVGVEEAWRDDRLWLLNALGGICDLRCFYHHLRTECGASEDRVLRVKRLIQRLRVLAYQTASQLKYCSPLGGPLIELRRSQGLKGVGEKTIQKLEAIGAITFPVIA
jgi:hypothetical protein